MGRGLSVGCRGISVGRGLRSWVLRDKLEVVELDKQTMTERNKYIP